MTKAEFEKLVTEYGELMREAGMYPHENWRLKSTAKAAAAKQAVLDAFEENAK